MKPGKRFRAQWVTVNDVFVEPEGRERVVSVRGSNHFREGKPVGLPMLTVEFIESPPRENDSYGVNVSLEDAKALVRTFPNRLEDGQFYEVLSSYLK